jgi:hypothetical protein
MNEFLEASGSPAKSALRVNPLARSGPRVRKRKTSEDEEKCFDRAVSRANKTTYTKMVNDILVGIFSNDYLANH